MLSQRAAKRSGKRYRGVVEAAGCSMARWHRNEAQRSRLRHAAEGSESGDKGRGAVVLIQLPTNAETNYRSAG